MIISKSIFYKIVLNSISRCLRFLLIKSRVIWYGCLFSAFPNLVYSHHSVSGQFDVTNSVEWTGVITKVDWINPHSYIHLDVTNDNGSTTTWRLETLPTAMFRKAKISKEMLVGESQQVTITGHVARDNTKNLGYIIRINYADGHFYQLSAEP